MNITRRAALRGGTAVAASAAVITAAGSVAAAPHEPLLGLWREYQQLLAERAPHKLRENGALRLI